MSDNQSYYKSKRFRSILQYYEECERDDVPCIISSDDYVDIAEYYNVVKNNADKAEKVIDIAIKLYPGVTSPLVFKSRIMLFVHHDAEKARYYLSLAEDQNDLDVYYLTAEMMIVDDKIAQANDYLKEKLTEVDEDDQQDYIWDVANLFLDYNNSEIADEWIAMIDDKEGTDYEELVSKSLICKGRYDESVEAINHLIDKNPFSNDYWNLLTMTHLKSEKNEEALDSSEYSIALNPEDEVAILNKGYALYQMGNIEESITYFKRYIELCPDDEVGPFNLGSCLVDLNRYEEAETFFKKAETLADQDSPRYIDILQNLLYISDKLGKKKDFQSYLQKIDQLPSDDAQTLIEKGIVFLFYGIYDKAEAYLLKALRKGGKSKEVLLQIASLLADNGFYISEDGKLEELKDNHTNKENPNELDNSTSK